MRTVAFDLDGTLLQGTTVSLVLAERDGRAAELAVLEQRYRRGEIDSAVIADTTAGWLAGTTVAETWDVLRAAPWIEGLAETTAALRQAGVRVLVATITWRAAAELLVAEHGFDAASGTEIEVVDGVLGGRVVRHFDEHDKLDFVAAQTGGDLSDVVAVGDSRSDLPLFAAVPRSIALNGDAQARAAAAEVVDTDDLRDLLPLLLG